MNMTLIPMQVSTVQSLIRYNKTQIKELETESAYLKHLIQLYFNSANPLTPNSTLSHTAFLCLNAAKDDLAKIKKQIKMLSEVQYSLKYSIR